MAIPIVESLWKPTEAIDITRNDGNMGTPIVLLVIAAVLSAISGAILTFALPRKGALTKVPLNPGIVAAVSFIGVLVGGLLLGLYLMMVMRALNTRSTYFAGVATVAHTAMPASLGFLIFSILSLGQLPGMIVGGIIALIFLALSAGTLYNATREFFETDMITALVGVSAFTASIALLAVLISMKGITFIKPTMPTVPTAPSL